MIGHSGGISHNGKLARPSATIPASASTLFQTLPARLPPWRRARCGKRREATCSTIAGRPKMPRISSAVNCTSGTSMSTMIALALNSAAALASQATNKVELASHCCISPASHSVACAQKTITRPPQSASAMSTGQIISQSMRGCSRLKNAKAIEPRNRVMSGSPADTLPQLRQPLDRDRHRRLQFLREQRHPQFLQQPAELLELRRRVQRTAQLCAPGELASQGLLERCQLGCALRIARRLRAQLLQPQRGCLEVAREMLQPFPGHAGEEPRLHQARALLL